MAKMQGLANLKCCQSGHSDEEKHTVMSCFSSSFVKFNKNSIKVDNFVRQVLPNRIRFVMFVTFAKIFVTTKKVRFL